MKTAAIVTARHARPPLCDKNLRLVAGRPLVGWPIKAAQDAKRVSRVFLSTDGAELAAVGSELGCTVLKRSPECSGDVPHAPVIREAVAQVLEQMPGLETVVVLLGNTVHIDGKTIDVCLEIMEARPDLTGICTVWQAQDDHPFRALALGEHGYLQPFGGPRNVSSNRQTYPAVYFYDQGVWAFRPEWAARKEGPSPWTWLGPRVHPVLREWVTGRDVHGQLDVDVSEWWISHER